METSAKAATSSKSSLPKGPYRELPSFIYLNVAKGTVFGQVHKVTPLAYRIGLKLRVERVRDIDVTKALKGHKTLLATVLKTRKTGENIV